MNITETMVTASLYPSGDMVLALEDAGTEFAGANATINYTGNMPEYTDDELDALVLGATDAWLREFGLETDGALTLDEGGSDDRRRYYYGGVWEV